jgi:outer membrane protein TolC
MLPSLSFSISERYGDSLLPSGTNPWLNHDATSWGFNLGFPILNVKSIVLGIHDANIALERAKISERSTEIQLRQTAVSSWLSFEQAVQQASYAAENLRLNQELYRQATEQYRLGQMTQLDLFTLQTGLTQARVSQLNALSDLRTQQAQIDFLLAR